MYLYIFKGLLYASALFTLVEGTQVNITEATDATPVKLNCSSYVEPYQWKYNGNPLAFNSSVYKVTDSKATGVYACTAENSTINFDAGNFSIPHISHGEKSIKVTEGDSDVTLSCTSYSFPTPEFHWTYDNGEKKGNISDLNNVKVKTNGTHSELTILTVAMDTRAYYICTAKNWVGSGSATMLVRVQNRLAPLWAFLAILAEVIVMAIITLAFARRKKQKQKAGNVSESANRNNETQRNAAKED